MLTSFLEFLALALLVGGGLAVLGLPIRTWLLDGADGRPSPLPVVFVGLAIVQLVTWYRLVLGGDAHGIGWVLLALGAVGTVCGLPRAVRSARRDPRRHLAPVVAGIGAAAVFVLSFTSLFRVGFQTTASLGNNDAASYAVVARHLVHEGFDESGRVSDEDLGDRARNDAFGSTAFVAVAADTAGLGAWKLTMPCLFTLFVVGAAALARLLAEVFPSRDVTVALASVAAVAAILSTYVTTEYFLGQVMAMAAAPALVLVAVRAVRAGDRRTQLRLAGSAAVLFLVLLSHYSHMIVPIIALLVPGVALLEPLGALRRSLGRISAVLGAGAVAAVVVAPQWLVDAASQTRDFSSVAAGWSLPGYLPVELIGFTSTIFPSGGGRWAWSAMVIVALGASVAVLVRRGEHGARWVGAACGAILLGDAAVYLWQGGPTYRQWKWITFFQPVFAAGTLTVVALALAGVVGRPGAERRSGRVGRTVPAALCVVVGVVAFLQSRASFRPYLTGARPYAYVDAGLAELAEAPALAGTAELNVDVGPYWDTMWVTYFLPEVQLHLQSASYFETSPPVAAWTLTPRAGDLGGPPYVPLSGRFRIEAPFAGSTSADGTGLDARVDVTNWSTSVADGTAALAHLVVTNTGTSSWLPSAAGTGAVHLGVHLVGVDGSPVAFDYARRALVPGWTRPILPGGTVTLDVAVPAPGPGTHVLEFQLVSEGVVWFGAPAVLPLEVTAAAADGGADNRPETARSAAASGSTVAR